MYPRVRVVIGRSHDWDKDRRRGLRRLNAHLTGIEVLTFDQILARADVMIGHLAASVKCRIPLHVLADAIHAFPTVARVLGTALADAAWELATGEKAWA